MSTIAIRAEGLGKRYTLGSLHKRPTRIGDQVLDLLQKPYRRAKAWMTRIQPASRESFWALQDASFEIHQGEVVGVIGRNGAGKSTLLKILSRITEPTEGFADLRGRVSSLLEVGTGFHPELTGRENIFLNGAILGMRKEEIKKNFDAIVDFSEIGQFVDTPVKHYSSGMYVRLAFAVAAHLQPDILFVDEVLAVGDLAFQKKCLGKLDSVSKQGRTILFVSHNLNAIQRLCPRSLLLDRGRIRNCGPTEKIVEEYLASSSMTAQPGEWIQLSGVSREGTGRVKFESIKYQSPGKETAHLPFPEGELEVLLNVVSDLPRAIDSLAVTLYDRYGTKLVNADTLALGMSIQLRKGSNHLRLRIQALHLNPGIYTLGLWAANPPNEIFDVIASAIPIEVAENKSEKARVLCDGLVPCHFKLEELDLSA